MAAQTKRGPLIVSCLATFMMRWLIPRPQGATARPFIAERMGPVLAPALLQDHRIRRPADLARLDLLHTETRRGAWSQWLATMGANGVEAEIDAATGPRFEHTYFLLEAAASGLGAAIDSYLVAPFGFVPSGNSYCLLSLGMAPNRAKIAVFAKWIMAAAA